MCLFSCVPDIPPDHLGFVVFSAKTLAALLFLSCWFRFGFVVFSAKTLLIIGFTTAQFRFGFVVFSAKTGYPKSVIEQLFRFGFVVFSAKTIADYHKYGRVVPVWLCCFFC